MLSRTQAQIIEVKCKKSQLIGHLDFFDPITEFVRELVIKKTGNKFWKDK